MTPREVRLVELKKRIVALDDERAAIAAEIAMLEQPSIPEMLFSDIASSEQGGRIIDQHSETDRKISLFREMFRGRTETLAGENAKLHDSTEGVTKFLCSVVDCSKLMIR